jgi:hypothetical protein
MHALRGLDFNHCGHLKDDDFGCFELHCIEQGSYNLLRRD